jgi:CubicO group peptidase (beta-lactamase class C family)
MPGKTPAPGDPSEPGAKACNQAQPEILPNPAQRPSTGAGAAVLWHPFRREMRWISVPVVAAALALALPAGAGAAEPRCPNPAPGQPFESRPAASLGFDQAALDRMLDDIASRNSGAVAVYRYGCLAGARYPSGPDQQWQSWSVAKSVTALAVARAVTLHLMSLDDRIGSLVTEADVPHGALPIRTLMQQSSGLHWNLFRDYGGAVTQRDDFIRNALTLPFDHEPGTWFEYAQVPVALTLLGVERAAGQSAKDFLDDQLFGPLGIPKDAWFWQKDAAGHTAGYYGVNMAERYFARLGQMLLQDGTWNGRRLIAPALVREIRTPAPTNPSYSLFFWVNAGDKLINATVDKRDIRDGGLIPGAPKDLYEMNGLFGQRVTIIPSLDLVLTRFGPVSGGKDAESPADEDEFDHAFVGGAIDALRDPDLPPFPPYQRRDSTEPEDPDYGFWKSMREPTDLLVAATLDEPELPPAGPPRARTAWLVTERGRVSKHGVLPLLIGCPPVAPAGDCRGPLQVVDRAAHVVGAIDFNVAPGKAQRVAVRVTRAFRDAARRGPVPAGVRMTSQDALDGTSTANDFVVGSPQPKAKHRHRHRRHARRHHRRR